METFEILCATMHQRDFSKLQEMNIHSDVVFANQADRTDLAELNVDGHRARMVTTTTRGVGKNRNMALLYAQGDICLFADDDVTYVDDMEKRILAEFAAHPDADIMIFHLESKNEARRQIMYPKTRKVHFWNRMPWGSYRIAFRRASVQKCNLWFTTLFGGGCVFPCGEDSMWLNAAKRAGLRFYVSCESIGTVAHDTSTWFQGYDEGFYYGKGAYHQAVHPKMFWLWQYYVLYRFRGKGSLSNREKLKWIRRGREGYRQILPYEAYVSASIQ